MIRICHHRQNAMQKSNLLPTNRATLKYPTFGYFISFGHFDKQVECKKEALKDENRKENSEQSAYQIK